MRDLRRDGFTVQFLHISTGHRISIVVDEACVDRSRALKVTISEHMGGI